MHSYADIAEELERRIGTGELPPGSKLPSYSELAGEFRVAITTASHAIRILRYKGLVKGFQGKGVYVLPLPDDF